MKAVVFTGPERIEMHDVEPPPCGPREVLIRVKTAGLCGTDVHIHRGEYMGDYPIIPGHEFAGEVVEVGREVEGFAEGDRVTADPNIDCGHCEFCRRQHNNHCLNWQGIGITRGGAFAEYVAAPAKQVYRLPDEIDFAAGALVEPLSCVVHAMHRMRVPPAGDALVFGVGAMGLQIVQMLRHGGAGRVIAVDREPVRLQLARDLGANQGVAADELDRLREIAPHGFDVVVDATGVPDVIRQCFDYLRPRGRFLQFGVAPNDATIDLNPFDVFKNDWTIIGSFALCYNFEASINLLRSGAVRTKPLISHTLTLEKFESGFERFANGETLKVHFT